MLLEELQFLWLIDGQSYRKGNWNFTLKKQEDHLSSFHWTNFLNWKLSLKVNTRDEDILESNEFYHLSRVSGAEKETGKEILKFGKFLSDHQASWWSAVQLCNWDVH